MYFHEYNSNKVVTYNVLNGNATINFVVPEYTMSTNKPSFQQLRLKSFLTGFYLGSTANLVMIAIKWTASEEDI